MRLSLIHRIKELDDKIKSLEKERSETNSLYVSLRTDKGIAALSEMKKINETILTNLEKEMFG